MSLGDQRVEDEARVALEGSDISQTQLAEKMKNIVIANREQTVKVINY